MRTAIDRHSGDDRAIDSHQPRGIYAPGGWMPIAVTPITPSPLSGAGRYIAPLWLETGRWKLAPDNDAEVRALFHRHTLSGANGNDPERSAVSRRSRVLPASGDRLILTTHQADALIVFRKFANPDREFGHGVHCAVFRNEGHFKSCSLIKEAIEDWAVKRWPGERFYTYLSGRRVVATNPGYPFKCAGWRRCGITYGGLFVMERLPSGA